MGRIFPWIALLLVVYTINGLWIGLPLTEPFVLFAGGSAGTFAVAIGDLIVFAGFALLLVEMVFAAWHFSYRTVVNHILSLLAVLAGVVLFVGVPSLRSVTLLDITGLMLSTFAPASGSRSW